jgi:lipopolysaccharide biosynthesis protein
MRRLAANGRPCDLLLSTDTAAKAGTLRAVTARYQWGEVLIRVVPNRGRDLGPLLTGFAAEVSAYDLIGHLHGKRTLQIDEGRLGDRWREFLWQHLVGDRHPMIFPADPNLSDWDGNLEMATDLAKTMGIEGPLPPFFDFPVGSMFWVRPDALRPLLELRLDWNDYPEEPVPADGTILHALERLLPFAARTAGYRFATTSVPGVTR